MKNIVDYSEFVLLIERGGGGDSFFDKIKNMGSTLRKFIKGKSVLKKAISMYTKASMKEIDLYKKYAQSLIKAKLKEDEIGKNRKYTLSLKDKKVKAEVERELELQEKTMDAEVEEIFAKVEGYVSDKSDNLTTYQQNVLNAKKNLLSTYVKIQKLKIDEKIYTKLDKENAVEKIKAKLKDELGNYKENEQKNKLVQDKYQKIEKAIEKKQDGKSTNSREDDKKRLESLKKKLEDEMNKEVKDDERIEKLKGYIKKLETKLS